MVVDDDSTNLRTAGHILRKIRWRSRRSAPVRRYINSVLQHPASIDPRILFVTYVGINKRDMDWIRKQAAKHMTFERIYFQKASPVIAVNCGHGTFGLLIRDADTNPPAAY